MSDTVRKLLEASGHGLALLLSEREVYGLGHLRGTYSDQSEKIFTIDVGRNGSWGLATGNPRLFTVRDAVPRLPETVLEMSLLEDTIARTLPGARMPVLCELAQAAAQHTHGAMLVISSDAAAEATPPGTPGLGRRCATAPAGRVDAADQHGRRRPDRYRRRLPRNRGHPRR